MGWGTGDGGRERLKTDDVVRVERDALSAG